MSKKILSLLFLLILLVSVTMSYAYFSQLTPSEDHPTNTDGDVTNDVISSEMDATLLDENEGIEIGDMI